MRSAIAEMGNPPVVKQVKITFCSERCVEWRIFDANIMSGVELSREQEHESYRLSYRMRSAVGGRTRVSIEISVNRQTARLIMGKVRANRPDSQTATRIGEEIHLFGRDLGFPDHLGVSYPVTQELLEAADKLGL